MPSFGAEFSCVQRPIIEYVTEQVIGWTHVPREEAEERRGGLAGLFFYDTLGQKLLDLNRDIDLDVELAGQIMQQMQGVRASIEGNRDILNYLRGAKTVYHPTKKRNLNITLIDFDHPENNIFEVTDEWSHTSGRITNRADLVFLINGIPVVVVETKAAHKDDAIEIGM